MTLNELKRLINNQLKDDIIIENNDQTVWDSLSHIEILLFLDKKFNGKIANITDIYKANNFLSLSNLLYQANLLEKK